jgi:hypothetical protein
VIGVKRNVRGTEPTFGYLNYTPYATKIHTRLACLLFPKETEVLEPMSHGLLQHPIVGTANLNSGAEVIIQWAETKVKLQFQNPL